MSKELAKSTVLNAVASIAIIVGGFFTTVIVARLLGPAAVGVVAYAAFIITLSIAILDIGIPGALMRFLPELEADGQDRQAGALMRFYFVPYLIASALYAAGLILLLDPASFSADGAYSGKLLVWLIAGAVLTQSLASFYYGALRGRMQFLSFAKFTLISALLQLATAWVGSRLFGISGAMAAPITGFLLAAIVAFRSLAYPGAVGRALNLRVANFAWRTWGSFVLTTLAWSRMEIYFLKHSWGDHAAGLFAAGLNLANLALQLPLLLTGALLPFLVLKSKAQSTEEFAQSYSTTLRYFAMLVFPACLGAAAITPALLPVIFGPSFTDAITPTIVLITGCITMTFITIVEKFTLAVEKTGILLWFAALGATLSIISGLTLTPLYGTLGAAVGRATAQAIVAAAMLIYAHRQGWRTPYAALAGIFMASLAAAAAAAAIVRVAPNVTGIATAVASAILIYICLCKYLHLLSGDDLRLVDRAADMANLPPILRSSFALTATWLRRGREKQPVPGQS